jgi:hypothetical protein
MLSKLTLNLSLAFSIRLKGPASQRLLVRGSLIKTKIYEDFFKSYYEQTNVM